MRKEYIPFKKTMFRNAFAASVAVLLAASPAASQEPTGVLKKIKDSGSITLGHRESSLPFSYYDDKQQVVGYSIDICMKVVDAIRRELKLDTLAVKLNPVTGATRIPLIANGTVDLECGTTTNNLERQKQVAFSNTFFLTSNAFASKKISGLLKVADLKGKVVVSPAGTTNVKQLNDVNTQRGLGMTIVSAKDYAEAFLMLETDRAVALVADDIMLASLIASSKTPGAYAISDDVLSLPEPYAPMLRRDDPAFKKVVDDATAAVYRSGEADAIYAKWFQSPIPPKGQALNVPMSPALRKAFAAPSDSGDPAAY